MAVRWDGFTEDDITKMKESSDKPDTLLLKMEGSFKGKRKSNLGSVQKISIEETVFPSPLTASAGDPSDMPSFKVISKLEKLETSSLPTPDTKNSSIDDVHVKKQQSDNFVTDILKSRDDLDDQHKKSLTAKLVLPSLSQPPPSAINLSDFRAKHRLMEEQNRARKVFLARALEDRKKRTQEEQLRLGMIQEELQKLDQRLSCDVSIIRNQIETASVEFMEAQKRYDRAEKEFLDAKLLLYTKLERKELLTHHLCTIIEQNEMRKAQKLSELMEKLQMPDSDVPQFHDEGAATKHDTAGTESKFKISSEIILTPTSVVSKTETSNGNGESSKLTNHGEIKETTKY